MAKVWVTEYRGFGRGDRGETMPAARQPAITTQVLDFSGGAVSSAVWGGDTRLVEVNCDAACHLLFWADGAVKKGATSDATTSDKRLSAEGTQFMTVQPGGILSVVGAA